MEQISITKMNGEYVALTVAIGLAVLVMYSREGNTTNKKGKIEDTNVKSGVGCAHPAMSRPEYKGCIYLDYNATTPIYPEVSEAILPFVTTCFGNPSSTNAFSKPCRDTVDSSRLAVGMLVGASDPKLEIYFTSCGTESDNRAIDIALHNYKGLDIPVIISCAIEHPAILQYLKLLEARGIIMLVVVGVDKHGFINVNELATALSINTALVTVMHSNNEVGTLQPIRAISSCIKQFNTKHGSSILLHSDAAQSLGKVAVDVLALGLDMMSIVGHKFGAPKGVAALYVRKGISMCSMLVGGGQENGIRAGTENVALIAGLGAAAKIACVEADALLVHMLSLKLQLINALLREFPSDKYPELMIFNGPERSCNPKDLQSDIKLIKAMIASDAQTQVANQSDSQVLLSDSDSSRNSSSSARRSSSSSSSLVEQLPNTVSVSFRHMRSSCTIASLADQVACSAGSACHTVCPAEPASSQAVLEANEHDIAAEIDLTSLRLSAVLQAMQVAPEHAMGTMRLSVGRHSTSHEVDQAVKRIAAVVKSRLQLS